MSERETKIPGALSARQAIFLAALPVLCMLASLASGRMSEAPLDLARAFLSKFGLSDGASRGAEIVVWTIRFPRVLLAALAGAGLSLSGCAFQSMFSNALATPDTIGVASGASFGAVLALLFGLGPVGAQASSLAFGLLAACVTASLGAGKREGPLAIILSGIMTGSLFSALVALVKFSADTESQLPAITYWLMGSLGGASYKSLAIGAPMIIAGALPLWLLRWRMNALPLSTDEARACGVNIRALRGVVMFCATAMTASCVSMCGQVGWVGLIVPHICRMAFGDSLLALVPASALAGASFLVAVDAVARTATAAEIPVSVLTALLGAPFFIYLVRRPGGASV